MTTADAGLGLRRRLSRDRVTKVGVLVAAFLLLRLAATVAGTTRFPDTGSYLQLDFLGNDQRLWTVPLIWNLLGSDQLRQVFQIGLGLVAWPLLACAVTGLLSNRWLALIAAACVLLVGLVPQVTGWDGAMLSESLATSLLVLLCALLVRMSMTRGPHLVAFTLLVTICWVFTRQSNALLYLVLLPFVLVFCLRRLDGRERLAVVAALLLVGGWGAYALTRDTPASQAVPTWNAVQIIENRIAPDPAALSFLTARGMPPSPVIAAERGDFPGGTSPLFEDPVFMTWIHRRFKSVYAAYLLHRWRATLIDPLRHTPGAITGPVTGGLPGRPVLPLALRDVMWGPGPVQILLWLAAMVVCAGIALARRSRTRCLPLIGLLLLSVVVGAIVTWNLTGYGSGEVIARGPGELARLFLPVAVLMRIAIVLVIALSLDALLVQRAVLLTSADGAMHRRFGAVRGLAGLQPSRTPDWIRPRLSQVAVDWRRPSPIGAAGTALAVTLAVLPELDRAAPAGPATLTPARFLVAVAGVAAVVDAVRQRNLLVVLRRPLTIALLMSLLAGVVLVWSSVATNGCNCRGSAAGIGEFALIGALATYVLARDRVWAGRFICAAAIGALVAAILAVPSLASGARATGSYGNPNDLAFALALGVPLIVAAAIDARNAKARAVLTTLAVVLAGMTFLTYSRGGLLAMAAGLVVFAALRASTTRARAVLGAAVICLAAAGVVLYPSFAGSRIDADLASATTGSLILHESGWDPLATGLIPAGPSTLTHLPDGNLKIVAHGAGEGASLSIGHARAGVAYTVSVAARSPGGATDMFLGLEDNKRALGPRTRRVRLSSRSRSYQLTWTPSASARHARVYAWVETSASFALTEVTLRTGGSRPLTARLTTDPVSPRALSRTQAAYERQNLHFRSRMLSLAWRAFGEHLLRGIGWEQFPRYVAARSDYGQQGAQSEYARYAAELGIGGVLFVIALALTAIVALWTDFPHRPAVAGSLTVAAVGLAFDNALETVSISAVTAVMLAIACTRHGRARSGREPD